jgi:uncharacterized protein (UPF0332 family)
MTGLPDELLKQADHLAQKEPRRPRQASLRRAVSAAYYALFHAIAEEFGRSFRSAQRSAASRLLEHGAAKAMAIQIANGGDPGALIGRSCPTSLRDVARDFVHLQKARHEADYDTGARFTRNDSLLAIARANRSVAAIRAARKTCPDDLEAFALTLVGGNQFHARLKP